MRSRGTLYWVCQLAGWGLYAAVNFLAYASTSRHPLRALALVLGFTGLGLLLTHLLRMRVGRRWRALRLRSLAPRVLVASVLCSAVVSLAGGLLARAVGEPSYGWAAQFVYFFNWSVIFFGWQLLYFGVHFLQRSRRAELEALHLEATANSAQLRQLQSQLNPHFLFNCLNALRGLIGEDPARAQDAVTQLANLLRYALADEGRTVPLSRELEVVQDYLALEALRLEERLKVRLEVSPECLAAPVPPMLVQTLVENAIKHGVARLPEGGELALSARRREGLLEIDVQNPRPAALGPSGGRIGLGNARERLRLLFGPLASIELDLNEPERATARVRIPWA